MNASEPSYMRIFRWVILALTATTIFRLDHLLLGHAVVGTLDPDSDQYVQFAYWLLGREAPTVGAHSWALGSDLRPPGYPFLLAIGFFLVPAGAASITLVHFVLWLVAWLALERAVSSDRVWAACLGFVAASYLMSGYALIVTSEWASFCVLVVLFAMVLRWSRLPTRNASLALMLTLSFLVLLRSEYVVLLLAAPFLIVRGHAPLFRRFTACAIGAIPLILWLSFNFVRWDRLTLSPLGGYSLMAIGPSLGPVDVPESDDPVFTKLAAAVQAQGEVVTNREIAELPLLEEGSGFYEKGIHNISLGIHVLMDEGIHPVEIDSYLSRYALASIRAHLGRYLLVVIAGMLSLVWSVPLLYPYWKLSKAGRMGEAWGYLAAPIIHILHVATIACINIIYLRYYMPTFALLVIGAALAMERGRSRPHGTTSR